MTNFSEQKRERMKEAERKDKLNIPEIVSSCCGAKTYSPDDESYTCLSCKEPCEPVDLSKEEK